MTSWLKQSNEKAKPSIYFDKLRTVQLSWKPKTKNRPEVKGHRSK